MSGTVSRIAKPQLRGLLTSQIKRSLMLAMGLCFIAAVADKVLINDRRKQAYAEFYKNYDINKEFERMRQRGVFDSC